MTFYIVDGSNVCHSGNRHRPDLRVLYVILTQIIKNGDDFLCIFDANFRHKFPKEMKFIVQKLLNEKSHFVTVTGETRADDVVLDYVDEALRKPELYANQIIKILSSDRFKSEGHYKEQYPWLAQSQELRVKINRVNDLISVAHESLRFRTTLNRKTKEYGDEFFAAFLSVKKQDTNSGGVSQDTASVEEEVEEIPILTTEDMEVSTLSSTDTNAVGDIIKIDDTVEESELTRSDILFAKIRAATRNPDRFYDKHLKNTNEIKD